jgi:hypothetical protein
VSAGDLDRISEVVEGWAATTGPIELRAEALDAFGAGEPSDAPGVPFLPIVRLAPIPALAGLWAAAATAGLPAGPDDAIGADGWIAHLTLARTVASPPPVVREPLLAWLRAAHASGASCRAGRVELHAFDGGPGRLVGSWPLAGGSSELPP